MRAGRLKDRISVIAAGTTTRTAEGAPVVSYSTILETWAQVEPITGNEAFSGNYRWSEADMRFTIRYSTVSIEPKHNIIFNGSTYNIMSVVDSSNAHRELVLMAMKTT